MDKLSEKIKDARISQGITIEEISKATLLSIQIIEDLENGHFDRFKGDELYVKMYLKKIAKYLKIDESIADEYYSLTREIKVSQVQTVEETKNNVDSTTFVDKVSEQLKNIQQPKPVKKKKVYEDKFLLRYVKYGIIAGLVVAMIVVVGWSIISTQEKDNTFKDNNQTDVDVSDSLKEKEKDKAEGKTDEAGQTAEPTEPAVTEFVFTRNGPGDFSMQIPANYDAETFKLKVEFTFTTAAKMTVNGAPFEGFTNGIYARELSGMALKDTLVEGSPCDTVEMDIPVEGFNELQFSYTWNYGHRYYINDQPIPLELEDHNSTNTGTLKTFKLARVE